MKPSTKMEYRKNKRGVFLNEEVFRSPTYLIRQHSMVRIGTNKKEKALYYLLQKEKDALDQLTHTKLLPEISRYTKTPLKELETMNSGRVFQKDISLNQPIKTGSTASLLDFQEDKTQNQFEEKLSDARQAVLLRKDFFSLFSLP